MRKILFSILTGSLVFIGCSKDSGNKNVSIVGTWNVNQIIVQSYLNNVLQGSDTTTAGAIEFGSDGNFTATDEDGNPSDGTYTYNSSSKTLTVISSGDTSNLNVTNLTSNNLHFIQDESAELAGSTIRVKIDADYGR